MATVDLGKVAARPRGEWDSATTYEALDIVHVTGGTYIALDSSTNVVPGTDDTKWSIMAADGQSLVNALINHTSAETTATGLEWGKVHVFPEMSSLDFSLAATPADGYEHEVVIIFETPSDVSEFNLAVPSTLKWGNSKELPSNIAALTKYEIRVSSSSMIAVYSAV